MIAAPENTTIIMATLPTIMKMACVLMTSRIKRGKAQAPQAAQAVMLRPLLLLLPSLPPSLLRKHQAQMVGGLPVLPRWALLHMERFAELHPEDTEIKCRSCLHPPALPPGGFSCPCSRSWLWASGSGLGACAGRLLWPCCFPPILSIIAPIMPPLRPFCKPHLWDFDAVRGIRPFLQPCFLPLARKECCPLVVLQ